METIIFNDAYNILNFWIDFNLYIGFYVADILKHHLWSIIINKMMNKSIFFCCVKENIYYNIVVIPVMIDPIFCTLYNIHQRWYTSNIFVH